MDVLVYGAGSYGRYYEIYAQKRADINIVAYLDRNPGGGGMVRAHRIVTPERISDFHYDAVVIANEEDADEIMQMLLDTYGVPEGKIQMANSRNREFYLDMRRNYRWETDTDPRVRWVQEFSRLAEEQGLDGNVAEAGVFTGGFAHYINKFFPRKVLYLFDTFEGFDARDLTVQRELPSDSFRGSVYDKNHFDSIKGEDWKGFVLSKMLHPENIVFKKGWFPETAEGFDDAFVFVNLDMDLYQPMLAGLRVFYDKLVPGGVVLLHDYFEPALGDGVHKAVADFEAERGERLAKMPIGDRCSLAIVKQ